MFIQIKKGRDGPATLACVRADGTRTWGKEHPFFPVHDITHCAVESVLGFDQAFFGLIAAGWSIDDFEKPRATRTMPFQALVAEHVVGVFDRERALPEPLTAGEFNETVIASLARRRATGVSTTDRGAAVPGPRTAADARGTLVRFAARGDPRDSFSRKGDAVMPKDNAKSQIRTYFAATPPKTRVALKKIRAAILSAAAGAEEAFSYRIPAFKLNGQPLVWYAAFKNHCSLFPMTGAIRRKLAADLEGYETSKGTVRLPLTRPMPSGLIKKLVKARMSEMRKGAADKT